MDGVYSGSITNNRFRIDEESERQIGQRQEAGSLGGSFSLGWRCCMDVLLNDVEARVFGALIEKSVTSSDYYPLTLNALVAACNQKNNRDPVMCLDEKAVVRALDAMRDRHLAWQVSVAGSRVFKYKHNLEGRFEWSEAQRAIMCELILRGPQTAGELRTHCERLYALPDVSQVEALLHGLAEFKDGALVKELPKEAGCREHRYAHLLCGDVSVPMQDILPQPEPATLAVRAENERLVALENEVAVIRKDLGELRALVAEFRKQFE